jgi:5-methylcytosine-specific restriction endonuclease McrA
VSGTNYSAPALCHCGTEIAKRFKSGKPHKHCSPQCNWMAASRKAGHQPLKRVGVHQCQHCRVEFKPRCSDRTTYCSRECAFAAKAETPSCTVWTGYCVECRTAIVARRSRLYCGDACAKIAHPYASTAPEIKVCKVCASSYAPPRSKTRQTDFCSAKCKLSARAAQKRIGRSKRRAIELRATIERVDPFTVFDRDGWRCQMCKVKTPKAKRGSYDNDAPELDHIIPLSKGGEHSYRNTQCSCRKCNSDKSDSPRGQLLMFG